MHISLSIYLCIDLPSKSIQEKRTKKLTTAENVHQLREESEFTLNKTVIFVCVYVQCQIVKVTTYCLSDFTDHKEKIILILSQNWMIL